MTLTKVLITVKTYPSISERYDELVCTAGFLEDGTWIRIYPVSFRKKPYNEQYRKYDWIEMDLVKNTSDFRPESYRPVDIDKEIKILDHIETHNNWEDRKKFAFGKVHYNLTDLIAEAKNTNIGTSLAVFKPAEILEFSIESVDREWDQDKLARLQQGNLFESGINGKIEVVKKLPYKFSYKLKDSQGKESKMMIEDWEIGQLYWRCLIRHKNDENKACADVKAKYFNDFAQTKDIYLFLGTTKTNHYVSYNPFIIVGTFHPPFPKPETQLKLF